MAVARRCFRGQAGGAQRHQPATGRVMASRTATGGVSHVAPWSRALTGTPLLLATIAVMPFVFSLPLLAEPMLKDEGVYFTVAMFDGLPYTTVFDHKPPLVFGWYRLALLLSGGDASVEAAHALAAVQLSVTALGVTWAGWLWRGRAFGIVAGFIASASTLNQYLQFNANTEVFLLPPLTFALGAWIAGVQRRSMPWFAACGVLSAIAIMTKTVAVLNAAALAGALLWSCRFAGVPWPFAWRACGVFAASCAAALALIVSPWALTGHWSEFWYANVTYNIAYSRETSPVAQFWAMTEIDGRVVAGGLAVWVLAAIGAGRMFERPITPAVASLFAMTAASVAGASATGREFAHYWVPVVPCAALLAAAAIVDLTSGWANARKRLHVEALLLALVVPSIIAAGQVYLADPERAHLEKNGNALESRWENDSASLAGFIASHTERDDEIFVFGLEAQLYALADRRPATYFNRPLAALRIDPATFERTMAELERDPPALIADSARTVIPAAISADAATSAVVTDVDPARRARFDAFLRRHSYTRLGRMEYAEVWALD
jgi:hypothetical protein